LQAPNQQIGSNWLRLVDG